MYKIFDVHTHTYPEAIAEKAVTALGKFYNFVPEGKGIYRELEQIGADAHISGFLLFSVATNAHQVQKVNDGIAAQVRQSRAAGFSTVGFAGIHQDYPDFASELDRITEMGLRGVKIHPDIQGINIDDPRMKNASFLFMCIWGTIARSTVFRLRGALSVCLNAIPICRWLRHIWADIRHGWMPPCWWLTRRCSLILPPQSGP